MLDHLVTAPTWPVVLEWIGVALGLAYVILALRRNRWCWVAGGVGSAIYVLISLRVHLPMQALLRGYYVVLAFYGWRHWSQAKGVRSITTLPFRHHALALGAGLIVSAGLAYVLHQQSDAAWPFLDSALMIFSIWAGWLEARMKLEHWLYWIVIDFLLAIIFAKQGLYYSSALFGLYFIIACGGYVRWRKSYRAPQQTAFA